MNIYSPAIRRLRPPNQSCIASLLKGRFYSALTSTQIETPADGVVIPRRIPRSPTDILKALEGTVVRDPTAAHYKYHDDPYLIPMSQSKKRVFALSQEAGRKAARWVRQEHKELFLYTVSDPPLKKLSPYKNADPPIEAYIPRAEYNETSKVCEEDLKTVMRNCFVADAKLVYNLLKSTNPEAISPESHQQFLELLCFCNDNELESNELLDEKWFRHSKWTPQNFQTHKVGWKDKGLAETTFASMTKTPEAYCAIIQGMCKYYQGARAHELYKECRQQGITLNTDVYNSLIGVVGFLKESTDLRWQLILELLGDMNEQGLSPNTQTLNSALESISSMGDLLNKDHCSQILAELVKECGVEPSLATWAHVLTINCNDRGPKNYILNTILDQLEGKTITIRDPNDVNFFVTAMGICRYHLKDMNVAHRLHELLMSGSNYDFIGDAYKENVYYRYYFSLVTHFESFDNFINIYENLVPHVYVPESSVMMEILKVLDANGSCEHYPYFWSHMVLFNHNVRDNLVSFLLRSMVQNLPEEVTPKEIKATEDVKIQENVSSTDELKLPPIDNVNTLGAALAIGLSEVRQHFEIPEQVITVQESFGKIAWDIWKKIEEQPEGRTKQLSWTGAMLGDILALLVRADRMDDAHLAVKRLNKIESVAGVPVSSDSLLNFARKAAKENNTAYATAAISYLSETGFPEAKSGAIDVLQTILNKSQPEVEELIKDAGSKKTDAWSANPNVAKLLTVANEKISTPKAQPQITTEEEVVDGSDSSSDSSDDEEGPKNKHKPRKS